MLIKVYDTLRGEPEEGAGFCGAAQLYVLNFLDTRVLFCVDFKVFQVVSDFYEPAVAGDAENRVLCDCGCYQLDG